MRCYLQMSMEKFVQLDGQKGDEGMKPNTTAGVAEYLAKNEGKL